MNYTINEKMYHLPGESYVRSFFRARGFTEEQEEKYLNPTETDLYDPLLLVNMDEGVTMLKKHLDNDSIIYLVVDCDCDGVCSSAIIYNYIKDIYPRAQIMWDMHEGKQHGVELKKVPKEANLVLIPDAGSNQYEEHKSLREDGYDVLVLDHHLCDKLSEDACVINNQMGDYPNRGLSGAGVVYKFVKYFDSKYGYDFANKYLDLAAIGIK